jgi:hypothetical protein
MGGRRPLVNRHPSSSAFRYQIYFYSLVCLYIIAALTTLRISNQKEMHCYQVGF